jgi:hypothetical protein
MSNRNMSLDVIVRMKDLLSSPLRRLTGSLKSLVGFARGIGIIGTAIAAISFMGPINEAAAFQQQLLDIAGTANLAGSAAFAFVDDAKGKYEDLGLKIGQMSQTIADGAGQMIAAGLNEDLVDKSIGSIGRAATAANSQFSDMSAVATSLLQTLKLPADQLDSALGGLVIAGKEGAFELKDMARYFPTLTSQMAKFGVTGREAVNFLGAALQIARKGTSDPAEAANNLKNFLSKILSPQTIKNFQKAGVDIEGVMRDAAVKGINPIEAVMQKIVKLSGVSSKEIAGLMKKAKANGLEGADALAQVREQLEKIHGAGALGGLFSDVQVMDFLIPFLGNVDEYKRIKEEVAKATGAVIDRDFNTQIQGLNRQLIIFHEIGTQAIREVGLAFGTWLPMINENLAAAIKWLRELDKSTGGMVRQALVFAGAGILITGALGALGIVLPIVAAGFEALLALLGPVGWLIAAVAAGGVYIYRNWATYGPQLSRVWNVAKLKFFDFAEGMRERSKRIIAAGRELIKYFAGPTRNELMRAWVDIKAGWGKLQTFFKGFTKGLKFNLDLSGLTIDDAQLAAFHGLDAALRGIKAGWEALKDFGNGFAPHLAAIGENLGSTINAIVRIGEGFGRLGVALAKIAGLDSGKMDSIFTVIGKFAGGLTEEAGRFVRDVADGIAWLVNKLADLAEAVANGIDWAGLLPDWVTGSWNKLAEAINSVKTAISGFSYKAGDILPNGTVAGSSANGTDRQAAQDDWLKGPPRLPANSNALPAQGSGAASANLTVTFKPTGPAAVTNVTSDNKSVTVNTGRVLGRN